jgi:hypothetical protein
MTERTTPLPLSECETTIAGTEETAGRFVAWSDACTKSTPTHPDYHEVVRERLRNSRSAAKRDVSPPLLHELRERLLDTQDVLNRRELPCSARSARLRRMSYGWLVARGLVLGLGVPTWRG